MSQKANPRLIGSFILIALFVSIGTFFLMNRDRFFSHTIKYVLYFQGSVKGLNVGSPVVFNGVPIGRVINISLVTDMQTLEIKIPVIIETNANSFIILNQKKRINPHAGNEEIRRFTDEMIAKGLRARLIPQSLLTGQMMIDLSYLPGTPVVLTPTTLKMIQIPTLPSITDELTKTLQKMPLDETFTRLNKLLEETSVFVATLNGDAPEIVKEIRKITALVESMSLKADKALDSFNEDSRTMLDLNKMLRDFSAAAESLRNWADYLERHPEALLKGKGGY